jgi:hypothetical protein
LPVRCEFATAAVSLLNPELLSIAGVQAAL